MDRLITKCGQICNLTTHRIIEACYKLTTPELRLIYSCISKINFKQIISKDELFTITSSEYADCFNIPKPNVTRELKQAVDKLWDREIIIKQENNDVFKTRWISRQAIYENGNAEIRFAVDVIPYLTTLMELGNFTKYKLENMGGLKSAYAIRLYELLKQYENLKTRKLTIDDLREILCLGDKYTAMRDFKKRVLDLAITEINTCTDLNVSYENIKTGRKVTGFLFTIKLNKDVKRVKSDKKYLNAKEVDAKARAGESYIDLYNRLENQGYTFTKTQKK